MNFQQKAVAIQALTGWQNFAIKLRGYNDWYVEHHIERKDGCMLSGGLTCGKTPEEAIDQCWEWLTNPPRGMYFVVNAMGPNRRAVKWNGFMWEDVQEDSIG